ncbi:regulatory LuxR family protein [Pseudonocardia hierapolitana]|uniref:Regulatory LuxR family protein n=1 Tax=Pseudonocardia hierapolitana TaxID=1128676 RepID=A0A561SK73_9PSEU|nr:LuxR family transcriptional regulator [Pseudonocardia hierapolitana]TWF75265.1 regulatory LuxR family protein [Pseudonocardia hierapolitana]
MTRQRGKGFRGGDGAGLLGRRAETAALDQMIAAVREGESRVLVVRGDAGVGKSALLDHVAHSPRNVRVLRAVGVESEMELAFATLHQLCVPLLDRLSRLPDPQHEALQTVFGIRAGAPPDRFLVGLAVLSLMSDVAEERPLLCVVDDAQWLDRASAQVLGFVARRLLAESIALVFGARQPGRDLHGLPELEITGLPVGDARALLDSATPSRLDQHIRDRIVAESRGNPLALLELPRGLTVNQVAGGFGLLQAGSLPGQIEQSFLTRIEALPADSRKLLLVAAAEPVGDPALVWRAAERLGVTPATAMAGGTDGLLSVDARMTFRHPLVRSAVYRAADAADRRAAHAALAAVTDAQVDPDRRAWHLAAAAVEPDDAVAGELERSADRAEARGGLAAAAAFLQRSVDLTPDPARRADRALSAAQAGLAAGSFGTALDLLDIAEAGTLDEFGRARVDLLRAEAAFAQRRGSDAPPLLLRAARTLESLDARLARDTYLDAWSAALFAGRLATAGDLREVSRAARAAPRPGGPTRASDLLLDGLALLFTEGRGSTIPLLKQAAAVFAGDGISIEEVLRWGWLATAAAAAAWDFETCMATATRQVEVARNAGALAVLAVGVNVLGQVATLAGDFAQASSLKAEADAVREATGTQVAHYGALVLAALRGRMSEAFPLIDATVANATSEGQGTAVQYAHWARSVVLNAVGRYDESFAVAELASDDTPELFVSAWALVEQVEAAARSGNDRGAAEAMGRLQERTRGTDELWGLGLEARSRGLVSEGASAEAAFLEAVEHLRRTRLRPELARTHLVYGEWLRRQLRRSDARTQLRSAYDMFVSIGMEAFADRARRELRAAGETVRKRSEAAASDELTAQERQIALMVRDGMTNPEIGARLFLSPRTVEWHLRRVFAKLSISSRRQLRDALPANGMETASA